MKIVYAGTPRFAVAPLKALKEAGCEIAAVVTQQDRPFGRRGVLTPPPVKEYALGAGIPVYQFGKIREHVAELAATGAEAMFTCAYGQILTREVLACFPRGVWNAHASLLPKYRGAAPIQRAVINGDAYTGITTMFMAAGMDTGDILLTERVPIGENTTTGELFDTLAECGGRLLVKTLDDIESGKITRIKQDDNLATYAEKISNEECLINFSSDAKSVHNRIRGLSPFPGAFAYLDGKIVKLYLLKLILFQLRKL